MNLLKDLDAGKKSPEEINVVVEIPKGSRNKYEYDKEKGVFILDRVLRSPFHYVGDYGFVPRTLCGDGDPLDVIVLVDQPSFPGCVINARPVAMLIMKDEKGTDEKILAVPADDSRYDEITDMGKVPSHILKEISHFFEQYKALEKGKWAKVEGWKSGEEAKKLIKASMEKFRKS
ncbi:MAG: inorganic diphosphatase [Candidatus Aenigmarchaeota archaeon]|nr:inorganic diphosphatase [Candidatus Aenigmarchaeota archaeon]